MREKELLIVTGATGGLGKAISMYFASLAVEDRTLYPILCCRNKDKADDLREYVEPLGLSRSDYEIFLTDLSSTTSVNELALRIKSLHMPIRVLVNNAGSMFGSYQTNAEGIEMSMAVNFYSSARLTEMLTVDMAPEGSIINVVSLVRKYTDIDSDFLKGYPNSYTRINHYAKSKLALSIFTAHMAERYPNLYINAVDPGVMNTKMLKMDRWYDRLADYLFRPFTLQPYQSLGAVMAACENTDGVSGCVFTKSKYFPMENKIKNHPLKHLILATICNSVELVTY
ncbi:MAG: SDR family NAD(P)-dependent oxidoreductase [Bacteroidales bacterium]|nr:SDR family NAD(P)-dependent oxidoreductase [Bacteroidales bacterium]MDD4672741.1 SDR family NAD(P)-dependent oxidoreductase [Bacteroidales bacterium]MDY0347759.1 SDR family NAD(P)-dependent oxidoreductase [Tenuifilaceae bacterium]